MILRQACFHCVSDCLISYYDLLRERLDGSVEQNRRSYTEALFLTGPSRQTGRILIIHSLCVKEAQARYSTMTSEACEDAVITVGATVPQSHQETKD